MWVRSPEPRRWPECSVVCHKHSACPFVRDAFLQRRGTFLQRYWPVGEFLQFGEFLHLCDCAPL
jgi:hypothetical protein